MCGIFAVINYGGDVQSFRQRALYLSKKVRHRGPDWSGCMTCGKHIFCHERLAIVGINSGAQPLTNDDNSIILSVNGEIYNYKTIKKQLKSAHFKTDSDCETILHLYNQIGVEVVQELDGVFAFVLYDQKQNRIIAARDPIGVFTLYYGYSSKYPGTTFFASEMKALREDCDTILSFPPGHIYDSLTGQVRRWFLPIWWEKTRIPEDPVDYTKLRKTLERSVRKRLMSDVPFGVLLSGGLDSSLIASIASRETHKILKAQLECRSVMSDTEDEEIDEDSDDIVISWPRLHSYSIGLKGSPDLAAARKVAHFLNTVHHEFIFTVQDGLDAIADVIYHLETYDVTTVRASTPMYLLSRKIKAMGVKMVLSGEGADEIFGGYLYFHSAPSKEAFHEETVERVKNLHTSDCLRANKSTMAWGLEARVPFLDKEFLDVALNIDPAEKVCKANRIEKYILRKAFDTPSNPYLPFDILWRQKEQFSDGVGYSWIDSLKDEAERRISDDIFAEREKRWPEDTPQTKEAYWYRDAFETWFPEKACNESVVRWFPRADWGCPQDPSGRAQKVHSAAYEKEHD